MLLHKVINFMNNVQFLRRRKGKKFQKKREGKGEERTKETKKKGTKVLMTQSHLSLLKITSMFVLGEAKPPTVTVLPKE